MMKIRAIAIFVISSLMLGCSIAFLLPKACVTIKVLDEGGNPVKRMQVGVGFARNTGSGGTFAGVNGITDNNGVFKAQGKTVKLISYRVYESGYYNSHGEYTFDRVVGGEWQPWNPEIKVYLRKIENPVSMYAREFGKVLPIKDKDIGCDLIANDWVKPYGKGTHSDVIFHLKKKYVDDSNYSADLLVKFSKGNDGFINFPLDMYKGSEFKLPRYAPEEGYKKQFERHVVRPSGGAEQDDYNENIGYVLKIRSSLPEGAMYGKIQRDIRVSAMGKGTASIGFTYYLNPDHTRNLEYDPKRNLFTDIKHYEPIGL